MIASLAALIALQGQPPRLRTILPNGATILVERTPGSKTTYTRLFLSSRGAEETPNTHGWRHLLEHLIAVGPNGHIDDQLEAQGIVLRAQTFRDATEIAVDGPLEKLDVCLDALSQMLRLRKLTPEDFTRELTILEQEKALMEVSNRLSDAAWSITYGDAGLSTFGDLTAMRRATPAAIADLHRRLTAGPNLVIVIAGDLDLDEATAKAKKIVAAAPRVDAVLTKRPEPKSGRRDDIDGLGEAYGLPVPAMDDPKTMATLAAGFALATEVEGTFLSYTPASRESLVLLGRAGENSGLGLKIASADPAALWPRGQILVRRWLRNQTADPSANASLRGLLLSQGTQFAPESMLKAMDAMTFAQFAEAVAGFQSAKGATVVGF